MQVSRRGQQNNIIRPRKKEKGFKYFIYLAFASICSFIMQSLRQIDLNLSLKCSPNVNILRWLHSLLMYMCHYSNINQCCNSQFKAKRRLKNCVLHLQLVVYYMLWTVHYLFISKFPCLSLISIVPQQMWFHNWCGCGHTGLVWIL